MLRVKNSHALLKKCLFILITIVPVTLSAQLIGIKTIPVATSDQFMIFPSQNLGMGGVSLALDDSLADPFVNPAKGALLKGAYVVSNPSVSFISRDMGSARTLPLSVLYGTPCWFSAVSLSIQELSPAVDNRDFISPLEGDGFARSLNDDMLDNSYLFASLGKKFSDGNLSFGASVFWARLNALSGVEFLYGNANKIEQSGEMLDLRFGFYGKLPERRTLEASAIYNDFNMTHLVTQSWWRFIDSPQALPEENRDHTRTWGAHLGYTQPFMDSPWQTGVAFTVNRKTHPKIPNYTLMNVPRDPGDTWAYSFGIGFSKSADQNTIGFDFLYQPIQSHTWAEAAVPVETVYRNIIPAGHKTVDNRFDFSNWIFRIGLRSDRQPFGLDLGLQVYRVSYWLDQKNYVQVRFRTQHESWFEWTGSFGFHLHLKSFKLRYTGRITTGTGLPSVDNTRSAGIKDNFSADFLPAPSGALLVDETIVFTHRVMLVIPISN